MRKITIILLFPAWITKDHDWIPAGKIKIYFDMIMGVCFEIWGKAYEGRLGPTLSVGPNIRLIITVRCQLWSLQGPFH